MARKGKRGTKIFQKAGGSPSALAPAEYNTDGAAIMPSQYSTTSGGGRRQRRRRSTRKTKGGDGVISTAVVPFGLLALQRYFKGNKTSKTGLSKFKKTFKRTFRKP